MSTWRKVLERMAHAAVSTRDLAWGVRLFLHVLENRGVTIMDFDHKDRGFYDLKFYGEKKAFLIFSSKKEA